MLGRFFPFFVTSGNGHLLRARQRSRAAKLDFQRLEARQLLSGNVQAFLVNDLWWIVGDDSSNQFVLGRSEGDVSLIGHNGTTINGGNSFVLQSEATQVERGIFISLNGGDDRITVQDGIFIDGALTIFGGSGSDQIAMEDVGVGNGLAIAADNGANRVALQDVRVTGRFFLEGGRNDDTFYLNRLEVEGPTRIKTGDGHDVLQIIDSSFAQFASLETNGGDDSLLLDGSTFSGGVHVSMGSGRDVVVMSGDNQVSGRAVFNAQAGSDAVHFETEATIPDSVLVDGGRGHDQTNLTSQNNGVRRVVRDVQGTSSDDSIAGMLLEPRRDVENRLEFVRGLVSSAPAIPAMTLVVQADSGQVVTSGGLSLTRRESIDLTGTTRPNAVVAVSRDGDNVFDDGTVTADSNGQFVITVDSLQGSLQNGVNTLLVRATDSLGRQLTETVTVYRAVGTVVRFSSSLGPIDFELNDAQAPLTVANFLNYQSRYLDSILHRSAKSGGNDFVIQGGGFRLNTGDELEVISTDAPVVSEASLDRSNVRGTLAMALQGGDPDSGTSQWFINMADNSFLDAQSFTVFGRVIGNGMVVADAIHDLNRFQLGELLEQSALNELPLRGYVPFSGVMQGAVSTTAGSDLITGVGTSFTTQLPPDRIARIAGEEVFISEIISDTEMRAATAFTTSTTNVSAFINRVPSRGQYVVFSQIAPLTIPQ